MSQNIKSILSQFNKSTAQGDAKAEAKVMASVLSQFDSQGVFASLVKPETKRSDDIADAVTLVNEHLDELTETQVAEVVAELHAIEQAYEKDIMDALVAKAVKNPSATSIGELMETDADAQESGEDVEPDEAPVVADEDVAKAIQAVAKMLGGLFQAIKQA